MDYIKNEKNGELTQKIQLTETSKNKKKMARKIYQRG